MPKIRYGRTELQVSRISLGGFPFGGVNRSRGWDPFTDEGKKLAIRTVHAAIDAGINLIDTAPSYGDGRSEEIIGDALDGRRREMYLATKVSYRGTPVELRSSIESSLRRLRTDVVDIIQFHGGMYEPEDVRHILQEGLLEELFALREAAEVDAGVSVLRQMTSGILQYLAARIAPEWQESHDIYRAAFEFVLSESRVHLANG